MRRMSKRLTWPLLGAMALGGGCATPKSAIVDGKEVPRLTLQLTGSPYDLKHEGAHPRPGGPSSGLESAGGSINGRICGMFVDVDAQHSGDHVQLVGSLDNKFPLSLRMDEQGTTRHITGNLGTQGVDVKVEPTRISGSVGARVFVVDAQANGMFSGFMKTPSPKGAVPGERSMAPIELAREPELAKMPPIDEALVVAGLFTCQSGTGQFRGTEVMELAIGGPAADRPDETSSIYTHGQ